MLDTKIKQAQHLKVICQITIYRFPNNINHKLFLWSWTPSYSLRIQKFKRMHKIIFWDSILGEILPPWKPSASPVTSDPGKEQASLLWGLPTFSWFIGRGLCIRFQKSKCGQHKKEKEQGLQGHRDGYKIPVARKWKWVSRNKGWISNWPSGIQNKLP